MFSIISFQLLHFHENVYGTSVGQVFRPLDMISGGSSILLKKCISLKMAEEWLYLQSYKHVMERKTTDIVVCVE